MACILDCIKGIGHVTEHYVTCKHVMRELSFFWFEIRVIVPLCHVCLAPSLSRVACSLCLAGKHLFL